MLELETATKTTAPAGHDVDDAADTDEWAEFWVDDGEKNGAGRTEFGGWRLSGMKWRSAESRTAFTRQKGESHTSRGAQRVYQWRTQREGNCGGGMREIHVESYHCESDANH